MKSRRFTVALSFPGEYRDFVSRVADCLAEKLSRPRILYDKYHEAEFARPNLDVHLPNLYRTQSDLIAIFLCAEYAKKRWCKLEWRSVRQLISTADEDRIMFLSFDEVGAIPEIGILDGDGYVSIGERSPEEIAALILERVGPQSLGPDETIVAQPTRPLSSPSQGRPRSPRDYIDGTVSRAAGDLDETKPLTMRALILQLNELFNRSTFRFDPLRECVTREWGARLHAAMQTLELLRIYSPFVSEHASDARTYERLMDEVNGYCLAMAAYLFEPPVKVSEMREFTGASEFMARLPKTKVFSAEIDDVTNSQVDGRRVRAIRQMDKLRKEFLGSQERDQSGNEPTALIIWVEKLGYLQQQEALAADPAQKFTLKKQIEEALAKIRELGG